MAGKAPTSTQVLFNQFHLQVEYLLLEFADGVLRPLTPRHHVAQISNLRRQERGLPLYSRVVTPDLPTLGGHRCPLCPGHLGISSQAPSVSLAPSHSSLVQNTGGAEP